MNRTYIIIVSLLTFILPAFACFIEVVAERTPFSIEMAAKWFIFFAVGLRLLLAGIRQSVKPAFTAEQIFHIQSKEVLPIVRELGFANFCFGIVGIISLFKPEWRIVSAFASGLYYGLAGLLHLIKKPVNTNERFAMVTDFFIFALLAFYCFQYWQ